MTRHRVLKDPATGEIFATDYDGAALTIRAGAAGLERETRYSRLPAEAAEALATGDELARLRKGFVLVNPAAAPGEPRLHRMIAPNWNGALVLAALDGQLVCNLYDRKAGHDTLLVIGRAAETLDRIDLPPRYRVRQLVGLPDLGRLLIRVDHQILSLSLSSRQLDELSRSSRRPAGFLAVAGHRAAWYEEPDAVVIDLASGQEALRWSIAPRHIAGVTLPMAGTLSHDGTLLALSRRKAQITLLDVASGDIKAVMQTNLCRIGELALMPDGRSVVVCEEGGASRLLCLDLPSRTDRCPWPDFGEDWTGGTLALHPAGRLLALASGGSVQLYDLATMKPVLSFQIEHIQKRCALAWSGTDLGLLTDFGCLSLYATG